MPTAKIKIKGEIFLKCYFYLLTFVADIYFLWGGRDSGKSYFVAQKLILECLQAKYFKCILIKKTYESIKDSQWALIKDIVAEWNLESYFTFIRSPLEIVCVNGNSFIARGCDNPAKMKSITNPTHAWYEEGNQLTEQDYITVSTTLRSNKGKVQEWFTFNPESEIDYEMFWLYKNYFKAHVEAGELNFNDTIQLKLEDGRQYAFKYVSCHTTYSDNDYCSLDRIARHEQLRMTNSYYYQTFTKGLWSIHSTGGEFLKDFKIARHVKNLSYNPIYPIYLSIDNNVFPFIAVTVWQIIKDEIGVYRINQIKELPGIDPNNTATKAGEQVIRWLQSISYNHSVYITGDRSTKSRNTIDDDKRSFFDIFSSAIKRGNYTVIDRMINNAPSVALVGDFVNAILSGDLTFAEISIDANCRLSINDYLISKQDKDGSILKKRITDKDKGISYEPNGHCLDTFKDLIVSVFWDEFKKFQSRFLNIPNAGGIQSFSRTSTSGKSKTKVTF
jgi:PBSX family phage terminase large subunit